MIWYPPILAYHRVLPQPGSDTPGVTPEAFERQMRILAERWRPVPLTEIVARLEAGAPTDRRWVAVTFDDGTEDLFTHAFPILRRHNIPATIFLIVANIGAPDGLKRDQILEMARGGITFGSHTLHHAYLPSVPPEQGRREIVDSKEEMEKMGLRVDLFSYPAGGFTREVQGIVREAGYRGACTTNRGEKRFPPDRWALRRVTMHGNATTPFSIWVRCSGYYGLNRRLRSPS